VVAASSTVNLAAMRVVDQQIPVGQNNNNIPQNIVVHPQNAAVNLHQNNNIIHPIPQNQQIQQNNNNPSIQQVQQNNNFQLQQQQQNQQQQQIHPEVRSEVIRDIIETERKRGRYFDSEKVTFVTKLYKELRQFELYAPKDQALVFQPLSEYHRFLIHRVVEKGFTKLTSFSIGEDTDRRTVICFEENKLHQELKVSKVKNFY
jgi:parvulin-like peptidyl-prolyl isomerase